MYLKGLRLLVVFCVSACGIAHAQQHIIIRQKPHKAFIEVGENKQVLNFDFIVQNKTNDSLTLTRLAVNVYDFLNRLVHSRFLDNNGTAPSITLLPERRFHDSSVHLVFNPFPEFKLSTPLNKLVYDWTFENNSGQKTVMKTEVLPVAYHQKEKFLFPIHGKALVYDAHDLYAHHRRFNFEFAPIKALGFTANFMRYAYDFVVTDTEGKVPPEGTADARHPGWRKPVYAVAAGTVIYAVSTQKDDHNFDISSLRTDPMALYGNCVAIQHSDGIVSVYAHLSESSVTLKTGQKVVSRQQIGTIGASGSSFFPHLHFEVRTSLAHDAEGLPSYFSNLQLVEGARKTLLRSGHAETGDLVEAR